MKLIRLKPDSPELATLCSINEEAFPPNERMNLTDDNGAVCGFFIIVLTDDCCYVAYFAVMAAYRGQGIGSQALKLLFEYCGNRQLIIDFEAIDEKAPNNEQRKRRRAFYLRNGFFPTGYFRHYMDCEFEVFSNWEIYNQQIFVKLLDSTRCAISDAEILAPPYRRD